MLSGRRAFKGAALQVWFMLSVRGYKSPCLCFHRLLLLLLPRQDKTIPASSTAAHTYPNTRTQRTAVKTWLDGVWRDKWWSAGVYDENCCFTHTHTHTISGCRTGRVKKYLFLQFCNLNSVCECTLPSFKVWPLEKKKPDCEPEDVKKQFLVLVCRLVQYHFKHFHPN